MTASVLVSLLAGLSNLAISLVVLISSPRQRLHRACATWGLSVATWNLGVFALSVVRTPELAEIWARITWTGVVFLPVSVVHFMELSFDLRRRRFAAWYAASALVALGVWTPFFIEGVRSVQGVWFARPGPGLWGFVLLAMPVAYFVSLRLLLQKTRSSELGLRRRAWLLTGVLLACQLLGANDILPVLGYDHYPFTETKIPLLGAWAAATYAVVVGYGIFSDQLIEMRISLGRSLANLMRLGLLFTICALLLLLLHVVAPRDMPIGGVLGALGALVIAATLAGFFSPRLLLQPSEKLRGRLYGDRFDYLDKIRALPEQMYQQPTPSRGLTRVCEGLRDTLRLGEVSLWYRDPVGAPQVAPEPSPQLNKSEREAGWSAVARESLIWTEREDLWVIPLRTVGEAPSGFLRLQAPRGHWLRLNELDREVIAELVSILAHQVERESIRASLELRRANDAKDRFLASINHEIRNPLNGLVGMVELLRAKSPAPEIAQRLETMRACADQLIAVVDNALDFASLSEGKLPARLTRFELSGLLRGSVTHLQPGATGRILWELPPEPVWLLGDGGKLRQIVSNYVANALKYGHPPHATVRAVLAPVKNGFMPLRIEVRNSAPREPDENLEAWFQPFNRGERARTNGTAGSGLGLAISRRLAEAMDGTVGARREDSDLIFHLICPMQLVPASHAPDQAQALEAVAPRLAGRRPLLLVIDDEAYNRDILVHHLQDWGFRIRQAASAAETLQRVREETPDLVITDWLLGDGAASEFLPALFALTPAKRPPVIVLSAYATEEKAQQAALSGADRFLTKPLRADLLAKALQELLPDACPTLSDAEPSAKSEPPGPRAESVIHELHAQWQNVTDTWIQNADAAARTVHRMRGLARLLPPSDLPEALADLERALADRANEAVTDAARAGVEALLPASSTPDRALEPASRPRS